MTIDLNTLKPGDTVLHRNGGRSVVNTVQFDTSFYSIIFDRYTSTKWDFSPDGCYGLQYICPFDIISIEPAPAKQTALEKWIKDQKDWMGENTHKLSAPVSTNGLITLAQAIQDTLAGYTTNTAGEG